jgi:hypothetical protein
MMLKYIAPVVAVAAATLASPSIGVAQDAPPSYVADPGVYAVILDTERFRVTRAVWRPGRLDAPHSHPIPSVVFPLTDCTLKVTSAEGTRIIHTHAGHPVEVPITFGHTAQNITHHTCAAAFFERK